MPRSEKAEQTSAGQIICEKARGILDKIKQVVAVPANVKLVVAGQAKLEPATAGPKVNCLLVSLCVLNFMPT